MEMATQTLLKITLAILVLAVLIMAILYASGLAGPLQARIDSLLGMLTQK